MINFYSENDFNLENTDLYKNWLQRVISSEDKRLGEISYIFCDDEYLLDINQRFLDHDTYTDIISFDDSTGNLLNGDIYISTERVKENAAEFNEDFYTELKRVIVHGILHYCGYKDKSKEDAALMRRKESEKIKLFHVEQS
ncbi:rRNA maturation RNase YbeY [Zunongwangia sp. SCSIO 43204]|uniref:rRNA maturation RNase YbeY n=1 Tax=Zunongwangia sp. SCSIO 43204 TaxID=2779359 RepID=UPI001CA86AE7|nr:rRNA maturation RNase YbeY [Zunongwangia sp. SCSIO 43204]UAB86377.1 rRNA maturation RNase YbeY [Zunongwangia sp. SCSIO 43204]